MWKIFIDKLDSIDKHLMLLLNYDGGYITRRTKLRLALIICVFVVSNSNMKAEEFKDSIPVGDHPFQSSSKEESKLDKFSSSRLYQMTYVGVPLVAAGLIVKREDDHFRSLRNDYMPKFRNHTDDYLQFALAAVMLGLKTAGVEGRSSWGRMLVSDAFAVMLMGGVVNTLKTTARNAPRRFQQSLLPFWSHSNSLHDCHYAFKGIWTQKSLDKYRCLYHGYSNGTYAYGQQ